MVRSYQERKVLGHITVLDGADTDLFQGSGELVERVVPVKFGAVHKAAGPSKDGRNRVGRGFLAFLMHPIVARHCAVRGFSLNGISVRCHQDRRHQSQRPKALRNRVGLHVTVIVLTGPNELATPFHGRSDHVIDQAMFVDDAGGIKLRLELGLEDFFEEVFEAPVIGLQNRVLC